MFGRSATGKHFIIRGDDRSAGRGETAGSLPEHITSSWIIAGYCITTADQKLINTTDSSDSWLA